MGSFLIGSLAGCGGLELTSSWRSQDISIDGAPADWDGVPSTYVETPNIALRVLNDDSYLHIFMSSPNTDLLAQIVGRGITVWFDPGGGKDRVFGIRIPGNIHDQTSMRSMTEDRSEMRKTLVEMIAEPIEYLELIGPDETLIAQLAVADAQDIKAALGYQNGWFICELAVPLHQADEHPYAIGVRDRPVIGMGFETPELDREDMMKSMRPEGGMPGGGGRDGPGGGGGRMGASGRSGGRPGPWMMKQLEVWTKVALAAEAGPDD
jgi:hypothetical protein